MTKHYLRHVVPLTAACPPATGAQHVLSFLRGVDDGIILIRTTSNTAFEDVAVFDIDATRHATVEGVDAWNVSVDINQIIGAATVYRFRLQHVDASMGCAQRIGPVVSPEFTTSGIKTWSPSWAWVDNTFGKNIVRLAVQAKNTSGSLTTVKIRVNTDDSYAEAPWSALADMRVHEIAVEVMKRIQDISRVNGQRNDLAEAEIIRRFDAEQTKFPAVMLLDIGYQDRGNASLGDSGRAKEGRAMLALKLFTNEGDPVVDTLRLERDVVDAVESGSQRLGLSYVNDLAFPSFVPMKADRDSQKLWGIGLQQVFVDYHHARGNI